MKLITSRKIYPKCVLVDQCECSTLWSNVQANRGIVQKQRQTIRDRTVSSSCACAYCHCYGCEGTIYVNCAEWNRSSRGYWFPFVLSSVPLKSVACQFSGWIDIRKSIQEIIASLPLACSRIPAHSFVFSFSNCRVEIARIIYRSDSCRISSVLPDSSPTVILQNLVICRGGNCYIIEFIECFSC